MVNTRNNDGLRPLHFASFEGHTDVVKKLLQHKARALDTGGVQSHQRVPAREVSPDSWNGSDVAADSFAAVLQPESEEKRQAVRSAGKDPHGSDACSEMSKNMDTVAAFDLPSEPGERSNFAVSDDLAEVLDDSTKVRKSDTALKSDVTGRIKRVNLLVRADSNDNLEARLTPGGILSSDGMAESSGASTPGASVKSDSVGNADLGLTVKPNSANNAVVSLSVMPNSAKNVDLGLAVTPNSVSDVGVDLSVTANSTKNADLGLAVGANGANNADLGQTIKSHATDNLVHKADKPDVTTKFLRSEEIDVNAAKIDVNSTQIDVNSTHIDVNAVQIDVNTTQTRVNATQLDASATHIDVYAAQTDVSAA